MPVDSLARLLGHNHLQTTQRYISGADITVRADFARAMQQLEINVLQPSAPRLEIKETLQLPYPQIGSRDDLQRLLSLLSGLPEWLADALRQYLCWRWSTWRADAAFQTGYNLVRAVTRIWQWIDANRPTTNWESFRRSDLEAWLVARNQDGVSQRTIRAELIQLRMILRFLSDRDYPIDPGLFRVQIPRVDQRLLPRYLPETDYQRLERFVLEQTSAETYQASLDRAMFLLLAHTGMRISELVHLRLGDVHLPRGVISIRQGKRNRDRTVYTTPLLNSALKRYLIKRHPLPEYDHLLISRLYKPPKDTGVRKRISFYGEQIGLHVTPHQLRHTLATRLLNRGMPIYSLQRLLGHEDLNTTQLYAQVYDETLYHQFQKAMDQVETMAVSTWPIPQSSELDWLLLDDSV